MVAGLLLALVEEKTMRISKQPRTLVYDVNARIESLLKQHEKENFKDEVCLKLPNTQDNHYKYRAAIVETMQYLREMNIRSAINSGTDALGQFYETFLKYANDASEMGIVLTPRHVTKFAVDVMNISHDDLIFDPTCGTGGFLVAALDLIRVNHYDQQPDVYKAFRNDCLFGVEQADDVFGLALVNMIFRGDGKSHIHNGNCFDNQFTYVKGQVQRLIRRGQSDKPRTRPFSRVLMNPPFAIREKERDFVDHALEQMCKGGLLFAVLPNSPITGDKADLNWRRQILKRHTVRAVVKMPNDLFQPTANKGTYALILEAWRSHETNDGVFFGIMHDDESASQKSKVLGARDRKDNVDRLTKDLARFLKDGRARIDPVPQEITVTALKMDTYLDFSSEAYIENSSQISDSAQPLRDLLLEMIRYSSRRPPTTRPIPESTKDFDLQDLFNIHRGKCPPLKTLDSGDIPVITTTEQFNGVADYYNVPDQYVTSKCITISANGSGGAAFWHPYRFTAVPDVLICEWQKGWEKSTAFCLYVCNAIRQNAWRYDYYRKSTLGRITADVKVTLPMKGNTVNYAYIEAEMKKLSDFAQLSDMIRSHTRNR